MERKIFTQGEPAPNFVAPCSNGNDRFHFDTIAGQFTVLCFYESLSHPGSVKVLDKLLEICRTNLKPDRTRIFCVSNDPNDKQHPLYEKLQDYVSFFWDFDKEIAAKYQCISESRNIERCTYVLDISLRFLTLLSMNDLEQHNNNFQHMLSSLPNVDEHAGIPLSAPILIVPRIFNKNFCKTLIDYFHKHESFSSGFMQEKEGKTVYNTDPGFKRRDDCSIEDRNIIQSINRCIHDKLAPEIKRAFQFDATHIERYIVARYKSNTGGFFRQHRDNTTKGTAHRKFACSINLNAESFDGGDLNFPEFGTRTYRAPTGGAVVFSCSLLHQCTPITQGIRYCTLPFLYDDAGKKVREENYKYIDKDSYNL